MIFSTKYFLNRPPRRLYNWNKKICFHNIFSDHFIILFTFYSFYSLEGRVTLSLIPLYHSTGFYHLPHLFDLFQIFFTTFVHFIRGLSRSIFPIIFCYSVDCFSVCSPHVDDPVTDLRGRSQRSSPPPPH